VATIGDSFSAGVVPHEFHFTTVAEQDLPGCSIANIGVPQIGPREYLFLLEDEALPLDPDFVVINLFIGNDLFDYQNEEPDARRRWLDRENLLIFEVPHRLFEIARERLRTEAARRSVEKENPSWPRDPRARLRLHPELVDPLLESAHHSEEKFLGIEMTRATGLNGNLSRSYDRLFNALMKMRAATGGSRLLMMLIPDEFQVEDPLWAEVLAKAGRPLERAGAQRDIGAWLTAQGIPYLDLLPALRATLPLSDGRRHLYHLRDTHFNARGNAIVGHELAQFLRPLLAHRAAP
jgi:hypothetical protein